MNNYKISVKETLERVVDIKATSEEEAIEKVKEMYYNEEIVLDYNDFVDYEIESLESE